MFTLEENAMLTPEDDILIKQETSCSKEEAVAKLLGWMRGVKRRKFVDFAPGFIAEKQLPYLYSLDGTVQDLLQDLRNDAYLRYYNAAIIDPSVEADVIADKQREAVARYDKLIDDAASYLRDIERELERGEASILRIDYEATELMDVTQLTLSSLDRWSHQKYGFSTFEPPSLPPETEIPAVTPKSDCTIEKPKQWKLRSQEKAILDTITHLGFDPKSIPKTKSGNAGVKSSVRSHLTGNDLFVGPTVFEKAWERLRKNKDINDKK